MLALSRSTARNRSERIGVGEVHRGVGAAAVPRTQRGALGLSGGVDDVDGQQDRGPCWVGQEVESLDHGHDETAQARQEEFDWTVIGMEAHLQTISAAMTSLTKGSSPVNLPTGWAKAHCGNDS